MVILNKLKKLLKHLKKQKMKISNILIKKVLVFQTFALIALQAIETSSSALKCFPSHGSCTRLEDQLKIIDYSSEVKETLHCTTLRTTPSHQKNLKQMCLHANTTSVEFELDSGGLFGQTSFFEVADSIRQYGLRRVLFFIIHMKGFNVESPLEIVTSRLENIEVYLDVLPFEFFDTNGKRVRTCAQFERLNSSYYFFSFKITVNLFELKYVTYGNEPVCEIVFENMQIEMLKISYLFHTFFKTNMPRFSKLPNNTYLNTYIQCLVLDGFNVDLTDSLLSSNVSI